MEAPSSSVLGTQMPEVPGLILCIFEEMVDRHSLVEYRFSSRKGFGPLLASGLREECADGRMAGGAFFFFRRCFFCRFSSTPVSSRSR